MSVFPSLTSSFLLDLSHERDAGKPLTFGSKLQLQGVFTSCILFNACFDMRLLISVFFSGEAITSGGVLQLSDGDALF